MMAIAVLISAAAIIVFGVLIRRHRVQEPSRARLLVNAPPTYANHSLNPYIPLHQIQTCDDCDDRAPASITDTIRCGNILKLVKIIFQEATDDDNTRRRQDVFVYYHWDDEQWVRAVLIPLISDQLGMAVLTEADFPSADIAWSY